MVYGNHQSIMLTLYNVGICNKRIHKLTNRLKMNSDHVWTMDPCETSLVVEMEGLPFNFT